MYQYLYQYQLVPYLIYRFLIYLPTYLMQEPPQQGITHSSTPSLPPSRLPAWYISLCMYVSVRPCISVYLSAYLSVCMYIHTYPCIPTKGTYQRYMHTCVLGYVVVSYFKNIFADPIDTKKPPDERPCTRPVFHNFTR